jgi:hypothetical protein
MQHGHLEPSPHFDANMMSFTTSSFGASQPHPASQSRPVTSHDDLDDSGIGLGLMDEREFAKRDSVQGQQMDTENRSLED